MWHPAGARSCSPTLGSRSTALPSIRKTSRGAKSRACGRHGPVPEPTPRARAVASFASASGERPLNPFHDLGLAILDRWRRADFDSGVFPEIAASALTERPPSAEVDPRDVVRWVHESPTLVPQADIESKFGQPAITVFRCEAFHIDVLFWVDGTTAIHQHGFSGAFHVMKGSSLQSRYRFNPSRRYNERLLSGTLELLNVELLAQGDVRPIEAGSDLVHALFHLDRPSVSVVVRTPSDDFAGPQYSYTRAGLAFDPFAKSESMTRKIQTLDLLQTLGDPDFESRARATVRASDSFLAFCVLTHLMRRIENPRISTSRFSRASDRITRSSSTSSKIHAEEERRDAYILLRRRLAKQSEHRFFLALLLNLPDRPHILEVVRRAFPLADPAETVVRWIADLAKLDAIHAWVTDTAIPRLQGNAPAILRRSHGSEFTPGRTPAARRDHGRRAARAYGGRRC